MAETVVTVLEEKKGKKPGIPAEELSRLYRLMVQTRLFEERMWALQRQGRISFFIGGLGEEACIVGAAAGLEPEDWIYPCYREIGAAFYRGYPMLTAMHQMFGDAADPIQGRQMPCHYSWRPGNFMSVSSPVGTQIPQAVGTAWAMKIRGEKKVALVFFGEGATSQGDFHVGLNFAGVFRTPTVFVCRNNGYAISTARDRQTASETFAAKAVAYGIPGVRVDGNDLLAMIAVVREAAERARRGEGATLIEALTYRKGAHSTSDDPRAYRSEEEVKAWDAKDPIARLRRYMIEGGMWDDARDAELVEGLQKEILAMAKEAEKTGPPPADSLFEEVFLRPTPQLLRQREELRAFLASTGGVAGGAHGHHG